MGMIWKVFPDETFLEESVKMAETLAQMPTRGLALTKMALNESFGNNFYNQVVLEDKYQTEAGLTRDYKEGLSAFL